MHALLVIRRYERHRVISSSPTPTQCLDRFKIHSDREYRDRDKTTIACIRRRRLYPV